MTTEKKTDGSALPAVTDSRVLVTRSDVPKGKEYKEYKQYLRYDFFYSCAYCSISEAEAMAIRLVIDHYEPRKARPELEHVYDNLMYACDECNSRKGDRSPPIKARAAGHKFFRPDHDIHEEHFTKTGVRLESKTATGEFTIDALDLNRFGLRRLRDIRSRLTQCDRHVAQGVLGLRSFPFDQLPPSVRARAIHFAQEAMKMAGEIVNEIDGVLRDSARSELIDPDPTSEKEAQARAAKLKRLEALFPDSWRAPRSPRGAR